MKILFICSSLEPGKDGVGDYTRRLACELVNQGVLVSIIALNDKFVSNLINEEQCDEEHCIPVLRLPASWQTTERLKHAKQYIDYFNPEWLSLQFVIFGHHPKGLPFGFGKQLKALGEGRKWHLMFHELWVGMARESPVKEKYWGLVQKQIIRNLVKSINPQVINTQSGLYRAQLAKINIQSDFLPLFGNVPVNKLNSRQADANKLTLIVFGTIHPGSLIQDFVSEAAEYVVKYPEAKLSVEIIGKNGGELDRWVLAWENAGFNVKIWGEQPVDTIAKVLSNASLGISSSAFTMIEKSGTVAAMRECGLNVIGVGNAYHPKGIADLTPPDGIFEYKPGNFEFCISKINGAPSVINVNYVAKLLKTTLTDNKPKN